jgi:hypothetical protein
MNQWVMITSLVSAAGFAGGSLCLSVTLRALLARPAADGTMIMQVLLPKMGSIMAPLLGAALMLGVYAAVVAVRGSYAHAGHWALAACAFILIAVVTVSVHFPINAQMLADGTLTGPQGEALLQRWLGWHHVRTLLALVAFISLVWPLRRAFT